MRGTKELHQHDQKKKKTLPQDYPHRLYVPSPSNRRRSEGQNADDVGKQRRQDVAYSSR